MATDLFGQEVPDQPAGTPCRPGTNDMDLIEAVLATATQVGYRLVGPRERVYRCADGRKGRIEPVPRHEEDAVHQLIDQKWLEIGGHHHCTYRQFEGMARSVLVPRKSRQRAAQWRALQRPTAWGPVRHGGVPADEQGPAPPGRHRILITGSRSWASPTRIRTVLAHWHRLYPNAILVHGDARGADRMAATIWESWGGRTEAHPANWDAFGRRAGFLRNEHMINLGATVCLAFIHNGSAGASHTARLAEKAGIPTVRTEHNAT